MQELKQRDYYFDNLKFVLIALVVIGHMMEPLYSASLSAKTLYNFIYFFHIPLFVFVTGYFSKKLDKLSNLLVLYIVFEVLYTLMDFYLNHRASLSFTFFLPFWLTWYLLAVILWKLVLPYFIRLKYPIATASVLAVLAGYAATDLGYNLASLRALNFFPFFLAGYFLKREHLNFLLKSRIKVISVLVMCITFYILYRYGQDLNCQWLWGSYSYQDLGSTEWYAGIYRIAVAAVTVILSICVLSLVPTGPTRISELGMRTMYPFLLHGFILKYLEHIGIYGYVHSGSDQLMLVLFAIALTVVLSMKWVQKSSRWLFNPNLSFLYKKKDGTAQNIQA